MLSGKVLNNSEHHIRFKTHLFGTVMRRKQEIILGKKLKRIGGGALLVFAGLFAVLSIEQTQSTVFTYSTKESCITGTEGPDWYHSVAVETDLRETCNDGSLTVCRRGDFNGDDEIVFIRINETTTNYSKGELLTQIPGFGGGLNCSAPENCATVTLPAAAISELSADGTMELLFETYGGTPGNQTDEVDMPCDSYDGNCSYIQTLTWDITGCTLPVEWQDISATQIGSDAEVIWSTASEENSDRFVIERSIDGNIFETIGTESAAGLSNSITHYRFLDQNITLLHGKDITYRLRQIDLDGAEQYSPKVHLKVDISSNARWSVYPNPASEDVKIRLDNISREDFPIELTVVNALGQEVHRELIEQTDVQISVQDWIPGSYFVNLNSRTIHESQQLIVD